MALKSVFFSDFNAKPKSSKPYFSDLGSRNLDSVTPIAEMGEPKMEKSLYSNLLTP